MTDLGDPALLLPSCVILFLALLATRQRVAARGWALSIALCIAAVVVAKIGFEAWGGRIPTLHIHSPSGHIALSTTFYGGVAILFGNRRPLALRLAAWLFALTVVVAIAITRLLLHLHTPQEVAVAFIIGGGGLGFLTVRRNWAEPVALPWTGLACLFAVLVFVAHGHDLTAEPELIHFARQL
ncbi:MAG: phosphatase PAP2 family protein [Ktedonobacteraceae bacterium]